MDVIISRTANTLAATIDGEIDAANGHVLTTKIGRGIAGGVDEVVIDVAKLEFIDSSGISRLVELRQMALDAGATFRLTHPAPNVRRVLEITGLLATFGIHE
ncbi:MAG: STAS domain-containing protein [Acidimicrobiales bacterium]